MENSEAVVEAKTLISPALHSAFEKSNKDELLNLLRYYKISETKDLSGTTLLHLAVTRNRWDLIEYLIENGCPVDAQNSNGATPLLGAVMKNNVYMVTVLCDAGADVCIADNKGLSPLSIVGRGVKLSESIIWRLVHALHIKVANAKLATKKLMDARCSIRHAIYLRNIKVTKAFLKSDCDVNAADQHTGLTALHVAVNVLDFDQVKLLLKHGVDPNAKDLFGRKPIAYAKQNCSTNILDLLLKAGTDIYEWDEQGNMQLDSIVVHGSREVIETILNYNPDLQRVDLLGNTIIHYAARNVNNGVAELFESKTFDPNFKNKHFGEPPLYVAARCTNVKFLQVLLSKGAKITNLPLFLVIENDLKFITRRIQCLRLLLAYGADINAEIIGKCVVAEVLKFENKELFAVILKHVAYLLALNLPVSAKNLDAIEADKLGKSVFSRMVREFEEMKKWVITGSITYFDILRSSVDEIAEYMRNETLRSALKNDVSSQFHFNRVKLETNIKLGLKLFEEITSVEESLSDTWQLSNQNARRIVNFMTPNYRNKFYKYVQNDDSKD